MVQYFVDIVLIITLIPIIIMCVSNPVFEKDNKRTFLIIVILTIAQIVTDIIRPTNKDLIFYTNFSYKAAVFMNFVIIPLLVYYFNKMMCPHRVWKKIKRYIFIYALLNTVVSVISLFNGILFKYNVQSHLIYDHGVLYNLYYYLNMLMLLVALFMDAYKKFKSKFRYTLTFSWYLIVVLFFTVLLFNTQVNMVSVICSFIIIIYFIDYLNYLIKLDSLSGVYNRRMYEYDMLKNKKKHLTVISVDVNCFKIYNDKYGHEYGDKVIIAVARELYKSFRLNGKVYRTGGDEFSIICEKLEDEDIVLKFNEINDNILCSIKYNCADTVLSYGYSHYNCQNEKNLHEIVKQADKKMYAFKNEIYKHINIK